MKRLTVRWSEVAVYEATIDVPDDYPDTIEGAADLPGSTVAWQEESDWWERVEAQIPEWSVKNLVEVSDRELLEVTAGEAIPGAYHGLVTR